MNKKPTYEELEKRIQKLEQFESKWKRAEKTIQGAEQFLASVFESIQDGICILNPDLSIRYVNRVIEKWYSKKLPLEGQKCFKCYHNSSNPCTPCPTLRCLKSGNTEMDIVTGLPGSDAEWLEIYSYPIRDDKTKEITGIVVFARDITKRKKNEESLWESENDLKEAQKLAHLGSWDLDILTGNLYWSDESYRIYGFKPKEFVPTYEKFKSILHPEDHERVQKAVDAALKDADKYDIDFRFIKPNGQTGWVHCNGQVSFDGEGKPIRFFGTQIDITERKQVENALKHSEQEMRSIFRAAPTGIGMVCDRAIQQVNDRFCKISGYSKNEVVGQSARMLYPNDEEFEYVGTEKYEQISKKGTGTVETKWKRKNGEIIDVLLSSTPINLDDLSKGVTFTALDISKQKRATDALLASNERFFTVLNSIDATIYVADMETYEILFMNKYMIESFGKDMTGEICWKVFRGESEPCAHCSNDQLIDKNGQPTDVYTWQGQNPITGKWYVNYDRVIEWTEGRLVRLQIATDITSFKKMEVQLQQSRKMESIGTLTGGIAHDFNNLLYMISGNTELALEDIPNWNPVHQNLQAIKTASLKAAGIVKQLLHFSRKTDQKLKPIGAVTVIKDSLKFLRSTIPSTIEIKTQLPDTEIPILADPIQINQIMMNLCINASHAMEETGGTLKINIETASLDKETVNSYPDLTIADNYLKITLNDTGPGIPSEIINRIFDPYFTTKEFGKGSGMGLTSVHGIVKNHNGAITVDSQVGKGTAFTILFPVIDEAPEITTKKKDAIPHGTETILFVDDEKAITNMMQQILEKLGYHVKVRLSPKEALDLFQSKPDSFDIVITDMTMPQMTGAKFAEKLKEIRSDIPIILCTGHSSLIDEDKAKQSGISGYVMKPVSMSKIAKAIREILDK
jgi:PAS domain S-box-containing protein